MPAAGRGEAARASSRPSDRGFTPSSRPPTCICHQTADPRRLFASSIRSVWPAGSLTASSSPRRTARATAIFSAGSSETAIAEGSTTINSRRWLATPDETRGSSRICARRCPTPTAPSSAPTVTTTSGSRVANNLAAIQGGARHQCDQHRRRRQRGARRIVMAPACGATGCHDTAIRSRTFQAGSAVGGHPGARAQPRRSWRNASPQAHHQPASQGSADLRIMSPRMSASQPPGWCWGAIRTPCRPAAVRRDRPARVVGRDRARLPQGDHARERRKGVGDGICGSSSGCAPRAGPGVAEPAAPVRRA